MATDENVAMLLDIIFYQLDKEQAKQLLGITGNNVQAATEKFYDTDIDSLKALLRDSKPKWDETAFGGGRYGEEDTSGAVPTFNIDYAPGFENYPHSTGNSRAPTRPPSRTSQRSAVSTHAGDAPIQSIEGTQESGVVGNSKPVFGPATRQHYDSSQWALVPTATEVISDPIPSQRQREEGQPAILKPSPNFNYFPALIPILHSIPQFRNALLAPKVSQTDYWMGDDWWKGSPSPPARIVDTTIGLAEQHGLDIIHEAQRLMAFLDNTDRVYGSTGSLQQLDAWTESSPPLEDPDDDLLKFLVLWGFAYQSQVADAQLDGVLRSTFNAGGEIRESFVLDGNVTRVQSRPDYSIYDVLDDTLFSSATGSAHIVDISNVLIFRLTSSRTDASDLGCRIPATLYVDRYLEKNRHVIDGMYSDMKQYEEQLKDIDMQAQRLRYYTPKKEGAKRVESLKLIQTSMKAFESPTDGSTPDPAEVAVLSQLQNLYQSIESKLAALDEQTAQVRKTLDNISGRFKPPVDDGTDVTMDATDVEYPKGQSPQDAMEYPYHLYGVATRRDVIYLLHSDIKSNDSGAKQWWRMQYDTESSNPVIMRDRLTLQEVIERATSESASALLIYANDAATSVEPLPLSKPLEDFVKKDKLNFLAELQKNAPGWEDYGDCGDTAKGGWDKEPPTYDYDWSNVSAKEFHSHDRNDSNISSTTLTPNTEVGDDGGGVREMVEVNGGMDALAGLSSSASSDTVGAEAMDVDRASLKDNASFRDVHMEEAQEDVNTQHIEVAEKKGG
ncbi:Nn.00g070410.m01.CDS01 [Neocucurbitaria sp. VM-36]